MPDDDKGQYTNKDVYDAYRKVGIKKSSADKDGEKIAYGPIAVDDMQDGLLYNRMVYFHDSGGKPIPIRKGADLDNYPLREAITGAMDGNPELTYYPKEWKGKQGVTNVAVALANKDGKVERIFFGYVTPDGELVLKHSLNVTKPETGKGIPGRRVESLDEPIRIQLGKDGELRPLKSPDVDKLKEEAKKLVMADGRLQDAIAKATDLATEIKKGYKGGSPETPTLELPGQATFRS